MTNKKIAENIKPIIKTKNKFKIKTKRKKDRIS